MARASSEAVLRTTLRAYRSGRDTSPAAGCARVCAVAPGGSALRCSAAAGGAGSSFGAAAAGASAATSASCARDDSAAPRVPRLGSITAVDTRRGEPVSVRRTATVRHLNKSASSSVVRPVTSRAARASLRVVLLRCASCCAPREACSAVPRAGPSDGNALTRRRTRRTATEQPACLPRLRQPASRGCAA